MSSFGRNLTRLTVVGAAIVTMGVTVPAATAAESTAVSRGAAVQLSSDANAETRAIAKSQGAAVVAAATYCGAGYEFTDAKALPSPTTRYGTLFFYTNADSTKACAVFDNNTSGAKYMDLRLWAGNNTAGAAVDKGTFSQYAGPVYSSTEASGGRCVGVSALMKNAAGTSLINYKGGYIFGGTGEGCP